MGWLSALLRDSVSIKWYQQPLGKVPDEILAKRLGVPASRVKRARSRRQIAPAERKVVAAMRFLGKEPDRKVAERLQVHKDTVVKWRRLLEIAPYRDSSPKALRDSIWRALPVGKEISFRAVCEKVLYDYGSVSDRQIRRYLDKLVQSGRVRRFNTGASSKWSYMKLRRV